MKNRIKELRTLKGIASKDLAQKAGIDNSMLNRLETGKRRLNVEMMERIAGVLDIAPVELIAEPKRQAMSEQDRELLVEIFESLAASYSQKKPIPPKPFKEILEEALHYMEKVTSKTQDLSEIKILIAKIGKT